MNSALKLTVILICCIVFGYVSKKVATGVPWMGVLLYKPDNQSNSEATHIVMIRYRIALANARDIGAVKWDSLKRYGKALFYSGDAPWEVGIDGHVLHPEYKNGSVNTIAILFLESSEIAHLWKPIKLIEDTEKVNRLSKIFSVGYTDHNHVLEQKMNAMEYVSQSTCKDFYVQEELDMEFLWPANPICFRVLDARETCVNDAGMALATNSTDEWLLMGLGTYGPGCSLPARYIEILPYAKWIKDNAATILAARRVEVKAVTSYPFNRPYEDEKLLERVQDASFTLYSSESRSMFKSQGRFMADVNESLLKATECLHH